MGPRGGGGFGFLHMIGGLVGMVLFLAILLGLAAHQREALMPLWRQHRARKN